MACRTYTEKDRMCVLKLSSLGKSYKDISSSMELGYDIVRHIIHSDREEKKKNSYLSFIKSKFKETGAFVLDFRVSSPKDYKLLEQLEAGNHFKLLRCDKDSTVRITLAQDYRGDDVCLI